MIFTFLVSPAIHSFSALKRFSHRDVMPNFCGSPYYIDGISLVSGEQAKRLPRETAPELEVDDRYKISIEVTHQIHCLVRPSSFLSALTYILIRFIELSPSTGVARNLFRRRLGTVRTRGGSSNRSSRPLFERSA